MRFLKWALIVVVGLAVIGALAPDENDQSGSAGNEPNRAAAAAPPAPTAETTPEPTPEPVSVTVRGAYETTQDQVTLRGRVNLRGATVKVNGRRVRIDGKTWLSTLAIAKKGDNDFRIVASKSGHKSDRTTHTVTRKLSAAERAAEAATEKQAFVSQAISVPYNQLEKNPRNHKGTKVVFRGQIFQIQEDYGQTWMLLSVTDEGYGFWTDNVWVDYDGTIRGAEDDVITVYGTITGAKSYETQIGGETYVPKMRAKYVDE